MKRNIMVIVAISLSVLVLTGCTASRGEYSGSIRDDAKPNYFAEDKVDTMSADVDSSGSVVPEFSSLPTAIDDERKADALLQKRIIYFDYDKALVDARYLSIIDAHADFLLRYPDKYIVLGGHTDDRGSNEYNLALGQRRADSVRDIMLATGVSPAQIESISFGEEQPRSRGQNELAWKENRRVEIHYTDE